MGHDKAYYHGLPVAAAAVTSAHAVAETLDLIKVDYEPLIPVPDVVEAMKGDAPLLHEDMTANSLGEATNK